jgi:hypothetical protein
MSGGAERLTLAVVGGPDTDDDELAELTELTGQLRRRLLELGVESVEPLRSTEVPPGAKPGELIILGSLSLRLTPRVLPSVVSFVTGWLKDRPMRAGAGAIAAVAQGRCEHSGGYSAPATSSASSSWWGAPSGGPDLRRPDESGPPAGTCSNRSALLLGNALLSFGKQSQGRSQ